MWIEWEIYIYFKLCFLCTSRRPLKTAFERFLIIFRKLIEENFESPNHTSRELWEPRWQEYWDTHTNGRHVHELIFTVSLQHHVEHNQLSNVLAYLDKFNCASFNLCECSEVETGSHAYFHCELTQCWNFKRQTFPHEGYVLNIFTRIPLLSKLEHSHKRLFQIANLTKPGHATVSAPPWHAFNCPLSLKVSVPRWNFVIFSAYIDLSAVCRVRFFCTRHMRHRVVVRFII